LSPMWREGATSGDIATTMDMSRGAVMGKSRQLGLLGPWRPSNPVPQRPPQRRRAPIPGLAARG
jgi:hypothetical protein